MSGEIAVALDVWKRGQPRRAEKRLRSVVASNRDSWKAWFLLGGIAHGRKDYRASVRAFRQVLRCRPNHERAFRGIFHGLWNLGRRIEALEETKRFIRTAKPGQHKDLIDEYMAIVREINSR